MSTQFNMNQGESFRARHNERLQEWAERVFAEPIADGNGINPRLYQGGFIGRDQEMVLYKDIHSRDSEVGLGLIDWRKADLAEAVAYLKAAVKKREHTAALVRSRQEALDKLTSSGQVAQDTQPQGELQKELAQLEADLTFLRAYSSKIDALERVLKVVGGESNLRVSRSTEQVLRLFSQSWRGLIKIKAWLSHFEDNARSLSLQPYKQPGEPAGVLLPLGDNLTVAISKETAGYLLHLVFTINALAEIVRNEILASDFNKEAGWSSAHKLVRAIVELFYFCNFEMPFSYVDLAIDPEDPSQLCVYDYQTGQWSIVTEDPNSGRTLKRVGSEAAHLLVNGSQLLKSRRDEDLNTIISGEASLISSPGETHNYRLFMCSGLSELDLDPASQKAKFRMAFGSMGFLLNAIVSGQEDLNLVSQSALGGSLETIIGMALLNSQAFGLAENSPGLEAAPRFQLLSQFWRVIGRQRAISMLGEEYVKQVKEGLAGLGEQGPEHPTFLTLRAGTVFSVGGSLLNPSSIKIEVEGKSEPPPQSPFASLGLSDQIRLLDLAVQTWKMSEEVLERLRDVHSQGKLRRIIESVPGLVAQRKEDIQMRFNAKWLTAKNWQWSFMRTCTPVAWDFWTKISGDEPWEAILTNSPPYQALGMLIRLFSDVVRLLLIIEQSGSEVSESLQVQAESAGQAIMTGLEGFFKEGERLPPPIAEAINFYYDPEIRFDSWLALTGSFRRYLKQMTQDLKTLSVDPQLLSSINGLIGQLEILYPIREVEEPANTKALTEPQAAVNTMIIDEKMAESIDFIAQEILFVPDSDIWSYFKLLSLATNTEKRNLVLLAGAHYNVVNSLLAEQSHRELLFNMPATTKTFFSFLAKLDKEGRPGTQRLNDMRPQLEDYFDQLGDLYNTLLVITEQIPAMLPVDKKRLGEYLVAAPQKSTGMRYLMLLVCNRLVIDVNDVDEPATIQAERAEQKIRAFLRDEMKAAIEEQSIEVYPIGCGRIIARKGQGILTSYDEGFEPIWSESLQPHSQNLYLRYITNKIFMVVQILQQEFPDHQILIR